MAKKIRNGIGAKEKEKKMSLCMKRFIESVIQEVEEAGIDGVYAVKEAAARVRSASKAAR